MMLSFLRSPLFQEAGDGDGGGGGAGSGAGAAGGTEGAGVSAGAGATGGDAGAAPVTRADLDAVLAQLSKLTQTAPPPQPKPKAGREDDDGMPAWFKPHAEALAAIQQQHQAKAQAEARSTFVDNVLGDVPEANREMARLMVEGLIAQQGIDPTKAGEKGIKAIHSALRDKFGTALYSVPGSQHRAIPKTASGYDWSEISHMSQVPAEMIKHIPDDVYRRLRAGGGQDAVLPNGGILPRSRFH